MKIYFKNILPFPLADSLKNSISEIWCQNDLVLDPNENIIVQAPSGKGKSTFLHILYGTRKDFTGNLSFEGFSGTLKSKEWDSFRKEKLSMVFQGIELFGHLSALENIELKNQLTNHKNPSQIDEMLTKLHISEIKNQKTETLSFGQKQRVAIIRALCQPFEWLFLDEPFSHLDAENSNSALSLIMDESKKKSAGVILTSLGNLDALLFSKTLRL